MIQTFSRETVVQFRVLPPLFLPFMNLGGAEQYYQYGAFDLDPFTLWAGPTSGSPVAIAGGSFFGFLNESGGRFAYDGRGTLSITCPAGQALYFDEDCNPYAAWEQYSALVRQSFPAQQNEAFWGGLEYCTWVEQKKTAALRENATCHSVLCEDFVYDYMRRVDAMKLPRGKLTIDDGWDLRSAADGSCIYGNWRLDREKFPHMEQLVRDMKADGFAPGLWFTPFTITPNSELALQHPQVVGELWDPGRDWHFIRPDPVLEAYYTNVFTPYVEMGFRKFKLDIAYGCKAEMKQLLALLHRIIKKLDPTIELECHIPDIFVSRYCDTVRLNDVSLEQNWRLVTMEHYRVCRYSSPHKLLNLDHLGTNTPLPAMEDFLEHSRMLLSLERGYPCVSLLPDFFGAAAVDTFAGCLREWQQRGR